MSNLPPKTEHVIRQMLSDLRKQEPLCTTCSARTELGVSECSYERCPMAEMRRL
jgi:hypothetical protein